MSEQIPKKCTEFIDDAKVGCASLVSKESCLKILSRAHNILSGKQLEQLVMYATEKMKEKTTFEA